MSSETYELTNVLPKSANFAHGGQLIFFGTNFSSTGEEACLVGSSVTPALNQPFQRAVTVTVTNPSSVAIPRYSVPVTINTPVVSCGSVYVVDEDVTGTGVQVMPDPDSCGGSSSVFWFRVGTIPGNGVRTFSVLLGATSGVKFPLPAVDSQMFDVAETFKTANPLLWLYPSTVAGSAGRTYVNDGATGLVVSGNWSAYSASAPAFMTVPSFQRPVQLRLRLTVVAGGCNNPYIAITDGVGAATPVQLVWNCGAVCLQGGATAPTCRPAHCVNASDVDVTVTALGASVAVALTDVCGAWSVVAAPSQLSGTSAVRVGVGARPTNTSTAFKTTFKRLWIQPAPAAAPVASVAPLALNRSVVVCQIPVVAPVNFTDGSAAVVVQFGQNGQNFVPFTAQPVAKAQVTYTGVSPAVVTSVYNHPLWLVGSGFPVVAAMSSRRLLSSSSSLRRLPTNATSVSSRFLSGMVARFGNDTSTATRRSDVVVVNETHAYTTLVPLPAGPIAAAGGASVTTPVFLSFDGLTWEPAGSVVESYSLYPVIADNFDVAVDMPTSGNTSEWYGVHTQYWTNYDGGSVTFNCTLADLLQSELASTGDSSTTSTSTTASDNSTVDGKYLLPAGTAHALTSQAFDATLGGNISFTAYPVLYSYPECSATDGTGLEVNTQTAFRQLQMFVELGTGSSWQTLLKLNVTATPVSNPVSYHVAIPPQLRLPVLQLRFRAQETPLTVAYALDAVVVSVVPVRVAPPVVVSRMFPRGGPVEAASDVEVVFTNVADNSAEATYATPSLVVPPPSVAPVFTVAFGPNISATAVYRRGADIVALLPRFPSGLGVTVVDAEVTACGVVVSSLMDTGFTYYDTPTVLSLQPRSLSRTSIEANMTLALSYVFVSDDAVVRVGLPDGVSYVPLTYILGEGSVVL